MAKWDSFCRTHLSKWAWNLILEPVNTYTDYKLIVGHGALVCDRHQGDHAANLPGDGVAGIFVPLLLSAAEQISSDLTTGKSVGTAILSTWCLALLFFVRCKCYITELCLWSPIFHLCEAGRVAQLWDILNLPSTGKRLQCKSEGHSLVQLTLLDMFHPRVVSCARLSVRATERSLFLFVSLAPIVKPKTEDLSICEQIKWARYFKCHVIRMVTGLVKTFHIRSRHLMYYCFLSTIVFLIWT